MTADTDIVERLKESASGAIAPWARDADDDLMEEAAAEIVRLRGEVCSCPSGDGSLRWPCKAHPPGAIAPAEAKGDVSMEADNAKAADAACLLAISSGYAWNGSEWLKARTPQPADGGAVAYWVPNARAGGDGSWEDGPGSLVHAEDASDYEKRIGTPLYTHPAGDALGAVLFGPNDVLRLWGCARVHDSVISDAALNSMRAVLTAALQHRGDSRGGEW